MRDKKVELHIVIDKHGINCVQIVGLPETHPEGHDIYFKIRDLIHKWDSEIQDRLNEAENISNINKN